MTAASILPCRKNTPLSFPYNSDRLPAGQEAETISCSFLPCRGLPRSPTAGWQKNQFQPERRQPPGKLPPSGCPPDTACQEQYPSIFGQVPLPLEKKPFRCLTVKTKSPPADSICSKELSATLSPSPETPPLSDTSAPKYCGFLPGNQTVLFPWLLNIPGIVPPCTFPPFLPHISCIPS